MPIKRSSRSTAWRWKAAKSFALPSKIRRTPRDCRAIVYRSPVPIVADIHFDHKMALAAVEAGVAKLRLNPGQHPRSEEGCRSRPGRQSQGIPIRVGVNMGSLAPDLEKTLGHTPEAMVGSAMRHVEMLEEHGHTDIAISLKAHDVHDHRRRISLDRQTSARARDAVRTAFGHHRGRLVARRYGEVVDWPGHPVVRRHRRYDSRFAGRRSDRRSSRLLGYPQVARPARKRLRNHGVSVVRPRGDLGARTRPRGRSDRQSRTTRR